jgi:catechol 2,3-dioxygenase-like lactoylglutathione lyase family enzyme
MRLSASASVLLVAVSVGAQAPVQRPRILGIAHLAVFVGDLEAARGFYRDFLGFEETLTVHKPDGSVDVAVMTISDRQSIELINRPTAGEGQLDHVALQTDDVGRMREYLVSRGVGAPSAVASGPGGGKQFFVIDPDGHRVEIVELSHLCLMVPDAARAVALLDSRPTRQRYSRAIESRTGINRKRQVNLFDPDGTRVELMEPDTIDGVPAPPSTLPPPR